jgi:site-specific DNA-methyltransferase (adenine-specific)
VTPYYADDLVTIYHGDCAEIMPGLTVDVVVTDPPYNGDLRYGPNTDDSRSWESYEDWLDCRIALMEAAARGPVLVFVSKPGLIRMAVKRPPKWVMSWSGAFGQPAGNMAGTFILPAWEPALLYGNLGTFRHGLRDSWHVAPSSDFEGRDHPCPKPLSLMRRIVDDMPGSSVLDPFAGSGTTLLAAKEAGRHAIGIEIEERYCEIAARRCSQEVLGLAI